MMTRGTYWSPFRSWERNKKVAIKHGFEGARSASCHEIDCELCASASPLEESTASLLLVSCTHGCSGQRCTETFLLRFHTRLGWRPVGAVTVVLSKKGRNEALCYNPSALATAADDSPRRPAGLPWRPR